jgi:pimeloyl-ACP methyl ester carboxylesterase
VLIATSCLPETPEGAAGREMAIAAFRADFEATIQGVARRGLGQPDAALQERLVHMMRGVGADTAVRQTQAIRERADRRAELAALTLPVQVLCGLKDRVTPPTLSQALADTVPGAELQWVENAGHMLPLEHPQVVADALRRALAA